MVLPVFWFKLKDCSHRFFQFAQRKVLFEVGYSNFVASFCIIDNLAIDQAKRSATSLSTIKVTGLSPIQTYKYSCFIASP